MRKRTIAAAAGLMAALLLTGQVFAAETFTAVEPVTMYVTNAVNGVNLRTAPDLSASIDRVLYYNDSVTVVGMGDFWAKTERGGKNYYIAKEFLTTVQGSARTAETAAAQAAAAETVAAAPVESAAAETAAAQTAETAARTAAAQAGSAQGIEVQSVSLTSDMRFAEYSKINSGAAKLYSNHGGAHGSTVICVNAGHGTRGGERVKTLSHPDGTGKVTGGSNPNGAVESISISSGMEFHDGTEERAVTLKEAIKVRDLLLKRGYSVLMIRETEDVQLDNIARTVLANNYALCHIAIHWDSSNNNKGAFFMSVPDGLKYMSPVAETWQKSEALGAALIQGLKGQGVKIFGDGTMDMDLTQTSYSTIASVDIELGDKASDRSDDTLNRLAQGIADGVDIWNAAR